MFNSRKYLNYHLSSLFSPSEILNFILKPESIVPNSIFDNLKKKALKTTDNFKNNFEEDAIIAGIRPVNISFSNSDPHDGSARVLFVEDKKEKWVYKPKKVEGEPNIRELFEEINNLTPRKTFCSPPISRGKNGYFTKFIECKNNTNATQIIEHIGQMIPFLSILGITDLHEENWTVKDNNIILLDYETTFNFNSLKSEILNSNLNSTSLFHEYSILDSQLLNPQDLTVSVFNDLTKKLPELFSVVDHNKAWKTMLYQVEKSSATIKKHGFHLQKLISYCIEKTSIRIVLKPTEYYTHVRNSILSKPLAIYDDLILNEKLETLLVKKHENFEKNDLFESESKSILAGDIPLCYMYKLQIIQADILIKKST